MLDERTIIEQETEEAEIIASNERQKELDELNEKISAKIDEYIEMLKENYNDESCEELDRLTCGVVIKAVSMYKSEALIKDPKIGSKALVEALEGLSERGNKV